MQTPTLENLPHAVHILSGDVQEIKKLLQQLTRPSTEKDQWFDIDELCKYHPDKPKKPTVYGWVSAGLIPSHKTGKRLRFLKSEIDLFLKEGKSTTQNDAANNADAFLSTANNRRRA